MTGTTTLRHPLSEDSDSAEKLRNGINHALSVHLITIQHREQVTAACPHLNLPDKALPKERTQALLGLSLFFAVIAIARIIFQHNQQRSKLPLPPGPRGWPLIGHLFEFLEALHSRANHLFYHKYAQEYVKAIFDKHASVSQNRPPTLVSRRYISDNRNLLHLDGSDPKFKNQRKIIQSHVGSVPKADEGLPYVHYETLKYIYEIANDPATQGSGPALWKSVWRYQFSNFALQFYGLDVPNFTDPTIDYVHETQVAQIFGTLPGAHVVDMLKFLRHLPMCLKPWERSGRARFRRDLEWCVQRMERVRNQIKPQEVSLMHKMIMDDNNLVHPSKEEGAYFCLGLLQASADTSANSTWSFIEAMMTFPDVQAKAHKILDEAIGSNRITEYSDYEHIPYIRCLVKETWRWRPPVAQSPEHVTTKEIEYNGYRIPSGSRLILNIWSINHDPVRHPDPETFNPDRYAGDETSAMQSVNSADVTKRDHFAFGAGRRVCPGYNVAERSLAVVIMRLLWAFEIRVKDGTRMPLNREEWRGDFAGSAGRDMPVVFRPRSRERVEIVRREFERARVGRGDVEPMDLPN